MELNQITESIISAAMEVHTVLGPGLLESMYEVALAHELELRGMSVDRQVQVPVSYKGIELNANYRIDLLVAQEVIVEIKATDHLVPLHAAQLLTYLRLKKKKLGLILNFNVSAMRSGIKRVVNQF